MAVNIIPIGAGSAITPFKSVFEAQPAQSSSPFRDMFAGALGNLEELNAIKNQDSVALALGNLDDIGAMQINSQKAEVALNLFVQLRNKTLEAYQEITRIGI
jgi:flagellar hook-basal body complex protein FliE